MDKNKLEVQISSIGRAFRSQVNDNTLGENWDIEAQRYRFINNFLFEMDDSLERQLDELDIVWFEALLNMNESDVIEKFGEGGRKKIYNLYCNIENIIKNKKMNSENIICMNNMQQVIILFKHRKLCVHFDVDSECYIEFTPCKMESLRWNTLAQYLHQNSYKSMATLFNKRIYEIEKSKGFNADLLFDIAKFII